MLKKLKELQRNDRGAMAVLVLLTIWALVVMLAMLWNTAEYGMRRQHVQNAADSTAHAGSTWMARSLNAIAAQNMVICQDASAEAIWRAASQVAPPQNLSSGPIRKELERELADVNAAVLKLRKFRDDVARAMATVDDNYALTLGELTAINSMAPKEPFTDPVATATLKTSLRQAGDALGWVQNTYVNGSPAGAGRPGPPGPGNQGLRQMWQNRPAGLQDTATLQLDPQVKQAINDAIQQELQILQTFETRTTPATSQDVPSQMAAHEKEVYQTELQMLAAVPVTIEQQRQQLADYYHCDVTLATLDADPTKTGPASVQAPMMPAIDVPYITDHMDSIRQAFPVEAQKEFGTADPNVFIDPISPHTDTVRIWYPNQPLPADVIATYPKLAKVTVNCNVPGGWGHIWTAPLEYYINQRVWNDSQDLRTQYMQPIDNIRTQLAKTIAQLMGLDQNPQQQTIPIAPLPGSLLDPVPDANGQPQQEPVLPKLTAPAGASAKFRAEVSVYNSHAGEYIGSVSALRNYLSNYQSIIMTFFNEFTTTFAVATWDNAIDNARNYVLQQLGINRQFIVLKSYKLRYLPDWAKDGMLASVEVRVREIIIQREMRTVGDTLRNQGIDSQTASLLAAQIVRDTASRVAPAIAAEWVSRPWPYEITPPEKPVPPSRGISKDERQHNYTVLAAARTTADTAPKPFLKAFFADSKNLVAYSQAEAFNWMEFNGSYGGADRYDEVTMSPYVSYWWGQLFIGCPRDRRLCSSGGWNWQSKLAFADALSPAMAVNQEFTAYLGDAGVSAGSSDEDQFKPINLH